MSHFESYRENFGKNLAMKGVLLISFETFPSTKYFTRKFYAMSNVILLNHRGQLSWHSNLSSAARRALQGLLSISKVYISARYPCQKLKHENLSNPK